MKKRVVAFSILLILSLSFIIAQNKTIDDSGYDCLKDKVEDNCDSLTYEQQIFSLLAIGECADEVEDDDDFMSDTKLTAQAVLALNHAHKDTEDAEEWLFSQQGTPENMDWLLQIDNKDETAATCTITYEGSDSLSVTVNEDQTINLGASGCFSSYQDYWLLISQDCYGTEFTISCTNTFSTNLLYKRVGGDTFYVSGQTSSSSAGGTTTEQVDSYCFTENGISCDYEASLWTALALDSTENDMAFYLPYLITMKNDLDNREYLPEAFLQSLTGDFRGELLAISLPVSGNEYYDTALAFLPFQGETLDEKTSAITWLKEKQGSDGCWNSGNIKDTAFILFSFWPKSVLGGGVDEEDENNCEDAGYHCMSLMSCSEAGGDPLDDYTGCLGVCCSKALPLGACADQGGEICSSDETCSISTSEASDTSECCLGSCQTPSEETQCELYVDGICRSSCYTDEQSVDYNCDSGEVCCIEKTVQPQKSYWWVWVLLILIVLVVLGIIFKDKLRQLFFKLKSQIGKGKGKPGPAPRGPRPPPGFPGAPIARTPSQARPLAPRPGTRPIGRPPKKDLDDVLKKLKEMGK